MQHQNDHRLQKNSKHQLSQTAIFVSATGTKRHYIYKNIILVCCGGVTIYRKIELLFLSRHLDVATQVERQHVAFVWFALRPWLRVRILSLHKTLECICGFRKMSVSTS